MENISIKKVETKREMDDFVKFTNWLYADCPYYVPDLEMDIRNTFNPRKNAGLEYSVLQPFIAYNEAGKPVGRIAGIINYRANQKWQTKNVRFGFIDFIDDLEVSAALLKTVEQWGKEHGMDYIQGPMGIFDFDKEGMLIEDFDKLGSMITIYNYPYYPKHMDTLGYEKEVDWVQVCIEVPKEIPSKYARVTQLSKEMFGLRVKKLTNADVVKHGYGRKVFKLLNTAYAPLFGYTELSDKQVDMYVKRYFPLIDKQMLPVIQNENEEVLAQRRKNMAKASKYAAEWHGSEEGKKWHSEHAKKQFASAKPKDFVCEWCGKTFSAMPNGINRFCSNKCKTAYRYHSGVDNETRKCKWCGREFTANKYSRTWYCSKSCSGKYSASVRNKND